MNDRKDEVVPAEKWLYLANGNRIAVSGAPNQNDRLAGPDEYEPPEPTHGRFECYGCEKVESYPLTQEAARAVVKRHARCKHGARPCVKARLTAGINLWPKRRR